MKIVAASFKHETNTFSPVPTPLAAFGYDGPLLDEAAHRGMRGTRTPIGAFIDLAERVGAQLATPIAADANPSGPVDPAAYRFACDRICAAVERGCDLLLLDLHGAMVVADTTDDGEGTLLARIRAVAPNLPIGVALDLHGNITETMVRNCDAIVGYKTYPHVDMYEAGDHVGRIMLRKLAGLAKPAMVWGNVPILAQTLRMCTEEGAMQDMVGRAQRSERGDVLACTVFGGFPAADIREAGMSVVVVTDGRPESGERVRDELLNLAWSRRDEFVYRGEPLEQAIARAKAIDEGPVLLLDHADNCASGATQDTMSVLAEALRQGLSNIAVGPVRDPEAVARLIDAGIGARVELPVGGKMDMPSIGLKGQPLVLSGRVRVIADGEYTISGPQLTGMRCSMGRTVVLDCGGAEVVVTERNQEPWDRGIFTSVGIDPTLKKYLLLKSRMYYRPVFLPIARAAVLCDSIGVGSSDWSLFDYRKVRRPIYPLDTEFSYSA